jgi:hypothetical protein
MTGRPGEFTRDCVLRDEGDAEAGDHGLLGWSRYCPFLVDSPFQAAGLEEPLHRHARTAAFSVFRTFWPTAMRSRCCWMTGTSNGVIYADPEAACLMRFRSTRRSFVQDMFNGRLTIVLERHRRGIGLWC